MLFQGHDDESIMSDINIAALVSVQIASKSPMESVATKIEPMEKTPAKVLPKKHKKNEPRYYYFMGFESIIEPELVESVDYIAGGFSPQYGDALGGVISLNLKYPLTAATAFKAIGSVYVQRRICGWVDPDRNLRCLPGRSGQRVDL